MGSLRSPITGVTLNTFFHTGLSYGISTLSYGICASISSQLFPLLVGRLLKLHGFLYLTAVFNLCAVLFVLFAIPETKVGAVVVVLPHMHIHSKVFVMMPERVARWLHFRGHFE